MGMMIKLDLGQYPGVGLIIRCASGVSYENQTCGTCCWHPQVEGIFVPLGFEWGDALSDVFNDSKYNGSGASKGIDDRDADRIDKVIGYYKTHHIQVHRLRLKESHEAWVHVLVMRDENVNRSLALWGGFEYPACGILMWSNSD